MALVYAHYEDAASTKINFNSIKYSCDFYNKNNGINDVLTEYLCTKDYNKRQIDTNCKDSIDDFESIIKMRENVKVK